MNKIKKIIHTFIAYINYSIEQKVSNSKIVKLITETFVGLTLLNSREEVIAYFPVSLYSTNYCHLYKHVMFMREMYKNLTKIRLIAGKVARVAGATILWYLNQLKMLTEKI